MADSTHPLNMDEVRGSFPALSRDQVYFDNAGGSQALGTVIEAIRDYLSSTNVQLGATYATSRRSSGRYGDGYAAAARYINASADEIVLGSSTTQVFRNASYTLNFSPGDELVISGIDHEANIAPWVDLAERQGLVLRWWWPRRGGDHNPKLTTGELDDLLSEKTRLVTLTHASNVLGTIHDVRAIAEAVHARAPEALVCVDGVAYAPHRRIDVRELGVDLYSFSWYKVFGPHLAVLYASPRAKAQMRSLGHFFNPHATLENRIGLAGSSYELVHGVVAAVTYLEATDAGSIAQHEERLQRRLLDYLSSRADVTVHGEASPDADLRVPTVSFTVAGWEPKDVVDALERDTNFGFRWGHFYSKRLVDEVLGLGSQGVVRVSMVHYNTTDEVQGFIDALDKVLRQRETEKSAGADDNS